MPITAKRPGLPPATGCSNAGLALERYLDKQGEPESVTDLLKAVCGIAASDAYTTAFGRYRNLGAPAGEFRGTFCLALASSLAIGLGGESALEVGFTTHRTYGMPMIPGSALKGLCRRVAQTLVSDDQFRTLFGKSDGGKRDISDVAGYVTFHDAWYVPGTGGGKPYHRDVITVHHQKYYYDGSEWPTDFDDPTPVPFLVVKKGAEFLFTLTAPNQEWYDFAKQALIWGLMNLGIGAKTNAGYGYFASPDHLGVQQNTGQAANQPGQTQAVIPNLAGEPFVWENARVTRNPGTGDLTVPNPQDGQPPARALSDRFDEVTAGLTDVQKGTLIEARLLTGATVSGTHAGRNWTIENITVPA